VHQEHITHYGNSQPADHALRARMQPARVHPYAMCAHKVITVLMQPIIQNPVDPVNTVVSAKVSAHIVQQDTTQQILAPHTAQFVQKDIDVRILSFFLSRVQLAQ
jgi:hypothetical protein